MANVLPPNLEEEKLRQASERVEALPNEIIAAQSEVELLQRQLESVGQKDFNKLSEKEKFELAIQYINNHKALNSSGVTDKHNAENIIKKPNSNNYQVNALTADLDLVEVEITPEQLNDFVAKQLANEKKLLLEQITKAQEAKASLDKELLTNQQIISSAKVTQAQTVPVSKSELLIKMEAIGKEIDEAVTKVKEIRQQEIEMAKLIKQENSLENNNEIKDKVRVLNTQVKENLQSIQSLLNNLRNENPQPGSNSPEDALVKSYNKKMQNLMGYELPNAPIIPGRTKESFEVLTKKTTAVEETANFEKEAEKAKKTFQIENVEDITRAKRHEGVGQTNEDLTGSARIGANNANKDRHVNAWKEVNANKFAIDKIKSTFTSNQYKDIVKVEDVIMTNEGRNKAGLHIKSTADQKIDFTATAESVVGKASEDNLKAMSEALVDNLKARMEVRPPQTGLSIDLSGCETPEVAKEFEKHIKEAMTKYPGMSEKVDIKTPEQPRITARVITSPEPTSSSQNTLG